MHAVIRWVRSCSKQNVGASSVSFTQNKQGQGSQKNLMAGYEFGLKVAWSTKGEVGGIVHHARVLGF